MIPIKSAPSKEHTMPHDNKTTPRIEEIIGEARERREMALWIQNRINVILTTIPIDCGINDKEKFLRLIELIAFDPEITTQLNTLIRNGVRIWVNYGELMKEKCQVAQDGSLMIADNASLDNIRAYLGILPF